MPDHEPLCPGCQPDGTCDYDRESPELPLPLSQRPEVRKLVRQAVMREREACAAYLDGIAPTCPDPVAVRFLARRLRDRPAP